MIVTHLDHPRRHRAIGVFDRPPAPIAVGWIDLTRGAPDLDVARFTGGLVVVFDDREAIGEIAFRRGDLPEDPAGVVAGSSLAVAARAHLRPVIEARALARALAPVVGTGPDGSGRRPSLTVAVPTRDRPQHIGACLDALGRLEVRADEILVVDNDPRHPCRDVALAAGARYMVEPRRGVNHARVRALTECRTELIAFTDDDCRPTPAWLRHAGEHFVDPLVAIVCGPALPGSLDSDAQVIFECQMGFTKGYETRRLDWLSLPPMAAGDAGASNNMLMRTAAARQLGLLAPEFGPGTPLPGGDDQYAVSRALAGGLRVVYEPRQAVWHVHRSDDAELTKQLHGYGLALGGMLATSLFEHGELSALPVSLWPFRHLAQQARAWRDGRRRPEDVRAALTLVGGLLLSPSARRRSRRINPPPRREPPMQSTGSAPHHAPTATPSMSLLVAAPPGGADEVGRRMGRLAEAGEAQELLVVASDGAGSAWNRAAERATGEVLVLIDHDCAPAPGSLRRFAAALADGDTVLLGAAYPTRIGGSLAQQIWAWEMCDRTTRRMRPGHPITFTDIDPGWMALRRERFLALGGFDEGLDRSPRQSGWELGYRLLADGIDVRSFPEAVARRDPRISAMHLAEGRFADGRGDVQLAGRHPLTYHGLGLGMHARPDQVPGPHWRALAHAGRLALGVGRPVARQALDELERALARRRWYAGLHRLLAATYRAGVQAALDEGHPLPSAPAHMTQVDLLAERPAVIGPALGEVTLTCGARELARFVIEGGQWSSEAVLQQVAWMPPSVISLVLSLRECRLRGSSLGAADLE